MKKYEKIYKELRKQYTDEEIAESMLIPKDLTPEELQKANEELLAFRFKLLKEQTEEQRLYAELLRFKYLLEDYLKISTFDESKTFGKHLEKYIHILKRTPKQLSEDLGIPYIHFNRLINDKEEPSIELIYRLEKHAANLIPALYWWKLVAKKQEHFIKQDIQTRQKEGAKVKNALEIRA